MIKLTHCFRLLLTAISFVGLYVIFNVVTADEPLPWWLTGFGVLLFIAPMLFVHLMQGTFEQMVNWCDNYDQERADEKFLRSKK